MGKSAPEDVNGIVEIPRNADPVKNEVDKTTGAFFRRPVHGRRHALSHQLRLRPALPAEDGDPVDVPVVIPMPLIPGSEVHRRPVGMLNMEDQSGLDAWTPAVPIDKLATWLTSTPAASATYPRELLDRIAHPFDHSLGAPEPGKWVDIRVWSRPAQARRNILESVERYNQGWTSPPSGPYPWPPRRPRRARGCAAS